MHPKAVMDLDCFCDSDRNIGFLFFFFFTEEHFIPLFKLRSRKDKHVIKIKDK